MLLTRSRRIGPAVRTRRGDNQWWRAVWPFVMASGVGGCGSEADCGRLACGLSPVERTSSGGAGGAGGASSGGSFIDLSPGGGGGLANTEVCREVTFSAEASPVNIHILLDRSVSMLEPVRLDDTASPTRWDAVTSALAAFVASDQAQGASVGLQFFGVTDGDDDCGVDKYVQPAVELRALADNRQALLDAIARTQPGSFTPTGPAIVGALTYARQVSLLPENADIPTVVVLASDGIPSECGRTTADGTMVASFAEIVSTLERFSQPEADADGVPLEPPILTYIIGTWELRHNADALARAGGGQAFLVGTEGGGAVEAEFLDALLRIVVKPLRCELDVPQTAPDTGERIDFDKVRVRFAGASSGQTVEFPRAEGPSACGASRAWFYDSEAAPQKIHFCRGACESLGAGDLQVELGCEPQHIVR